MTIKNKRIIYHCESPTIIVVISGRNPFKGLKPLK
jgi:hypothetical protein